MTRSGIADAQGTRPVVSSTHRKRHTRDGLNEKQPRAFLQEGWVIANHILVSFHVAFISSVLALPSVEILKGEVLEFIFLSPETIVSALFMYISFHCAIALHEMGHWITAARLNALNDTSQEYAIKLLRAAPREKWLGYLKVFALAPFGRAPGIKCEKLNYYPDAPYNLAVAAAGPRMSRNVALIVLPPAVLCLAAGLNFDWMFFINIGRLFLGIGIVAFLDFLLADRGKYKEFREREKKAEAKAAAVTKGSAWWQEAATAHRKMLTSRIDEVTHPRLGRVAAPWQFRNCGMGGRHTEKDYPESNISMQEAMFLILGARDYQEAQEMTVRLQNRLKEIIEKAEGCRVMGIGLEGGIAPYIERGDYPMPEVRLWAMMKRTIEECGYRPGVDVAIALDPAMGELETAYREHHNVPDAVGMYLFWRDKALAVLDRDGVLALYVKAIQEYDIPVLSIEDGFSETDFEGWQNLLKELGDRVFVIGDDLVTTNDATIELAASKGLINTSLIKANQIGTLYETILAMLVALGKGQELVVSHRSKSPNDDMEAQIALAVNALGLKCGGGANTERLVKYSAITEYMQREVSEDERHGVKPDQNPVVRRMHAFEEPTNAGVPTVGAIIEFDLPDAGVSLKFRGATPLGTSAGTGEAIHLVDSVFERAEYREVIDRYPSLFVEKEAGVYAFAPDTKESKVKDLNDEALSELYHRSQRYEGKGCLNAVENVSTIIAPAFAGRIVSALSLKDVDRELLSLELHVARRRGKLSDSASLKERIHVMQRKQNIGMNAMLSVSLAMARGLAHLKGQDLFELLREEIYSIVEKLARSYGVEIQGGRFDDYVDALREATGRVESQGKQLHEVLRELTGIYSDADDDADPRREKTIPAAPAIAAEPVAATSKAPLLTGEDKARVEQVSRQLAEVYSKETDIVTRHDVLYEYVTAKLAVNKSTGRFGIVNNRVYMGDDRMYIPYLVENTLLVHAASNGGVDTIFEREVRPGVILTDELLSRAAGVEGDVIDLEDELFNFDSSRAVPVRVGRIRDVAEQLKKINESANRNEAVYVLRILVARLSLFSFKQYLHAKNLQSEVRNLLRELVRFINAPLSARLPFLVRILVRDVAAVVTRPKLIDRLWNDTVDLAEIHVRGSEIVNEIRRSTHHAVGRHTLTLVRAYLSYLETGDTSALADSGYPVPSSADEEARALEQPVVIARRIVDDLEELLGSSETVSRIRDWQQQWETTLVRCEFGKTLEGEARDVINGLREGNRWVYLHHLRLVKGRLAQFEHSLEGAEETVSRLDDLLALKPDEDGFDAAAVEAEVTAIVDEFVTRVRAVYQTELFDNLEQFLSAYDRNEFYTTFKTICEQRDSLRANLDQRAFPEQRLLLLELDCLLEEMGYLALRNIASEYDENGVDFSQCLDVIHSCVLNLTHNGLHSRQLRDLSEMLRDPCRTYAEIRNVVEQIHRNYHHIVQRVIAPFEKVRDKIGLDQEDLRIALANMQRYMHDLNSVAYFSDMARAYIENQVDDLYATVRDGATPDHDPFDIIHISHTDEIRRRVNLDDPEHNLRDMYGGKGSGLLYISHLNIPTRDGFILPTALPRTGLHHNDPGRLHDELVKHIGILEDDVLRRDGVGRKFGDANRPLLIAVRGGSAFSMPGMLSTVLFVGMNDEIAAGMAEEDPWCAYDSYRRFLASYGQAVWGVDMETYNIVEDTKRRYNVKYKDDLPWEGMKEIAEATKTILGKEGYGEALEEILRDPIRQLTTTVRAVFDSWDGEAPRRYREIKGMCESWHTATIVQEMAMGNYKGAEVVEGMDETQASLTGVIPRTYVTDLGVRKFIGDFKFSAAGDDLVGGLTKSISFRPIDELGAYMPMLTRRMRHVVAKLRRFMGSDQEIEFTVERGVLSVLQSRAAQIGVNERETAFSDAGPEAARGIGIRGSGFRGFVAFDEDDLHEIKRDDLSQRDDVDGVIVVLENPAPEQIPLLLEADGLLSAKGGSTSHAAIAINGIEGRDYSAVMSAAGLHVNARKHEATITDKNGTTHTFHKGDVISIHGTTGDVYVGGRELSHA